MRARMLKGVVLLMALLLGAAGLALAEGTADIALLRAQEGAAALLRGNFDRAVSLYDQALEAKKLPPVRMASLYSDRGVAKWRLHQLKPAIADFDKAIALYPDYAPLYNNRGNVYLELGKLDAAITDFNKAIALAPGYGAAYNNRGNARLRQGLSQAAETDFRKAATLMPSNAVPLNNRGKAAGMLNHPFAGLRYLSRALVLNRNYASAYRNRAALYMHVEHYDAALSDLNQALSSAPEDAALLLRRGKVYAAMGNYWAALADFSKVIELEPENAAAFAGRGQSRMALRQHEQALADCTQAVTLDAALVSAYLCRAEITVGLGQYDEARGDIAKVLELNPKEVGGFRLRGLLAEKEDDVPGAIKAYQRALELDPFLDSVRAALVAISHAQEANGQQAGQEADGQQGQQEADSQQGQQGADDQQGKQGADAQQGKQDAAPVADPPSLTDRAIGDPVQGWSIISPASGAYVAVNDAYPKLHVLLEMYGEGTPQILEWTRLTKTLNGFGLLRYDAGDMPDGAVRASDRLPEAVAEAKNKAKAQGDQADAGKGERQAPHYEYVAIIDIRKNRVISIEPFRIGNEKSKWEWGAVSVSVTDQDGIISAYQLAKPAPKVVRRPPPSNQEQPSVFDRWFGDNRHQDSPPRHRQRPRNLFDWLFN